MTDLEFECDLCSYKTNKFYNLNRHIALKHSETEEKYKCDHCDLTFVTLFSKQRHERNACKNSQNVTPNSQNVTPISQNVTPIVNINCCSHCGKQLYHKYNVKRHEEICKGLEASLECIHCHKVFANRFSKSRHIKHCKSQTLIPSQTSDTNTQVTTNNINTLNTQINNTNSNHSNVNSFNNTVNIITFSQDSSQRIMFKRDHVTGQEMLEFLKQSIQSNPGEFEKEFATRYYTALLENPENHCVRKTNMRANYSKVHIGDNKWKQKHDEQVYPKMVSDLSECLFEYVNSNKNNKNISACLINALDIFVNYMAENGYCNEDAETSARVYKTYRQLVNIIKNTVFDYTLEDEKK